MKRLLKISQQFLFKAKMFSLFSAERWSRSDFRSTYRQVLIHVHQINSWSTSKILRTGPREVKVLHNDFLIDSFLSDCISADPFLGSTPSDVHCRILWLLQKWAERISFFHFMQSKGDESIKSKCESETPHEILYGIFRKNEKIPMKTSQSWKNDLP